MANAANLVNFGTSGLNIGDWTYSPTSLTAPTYLPLTDNTVSYLASSYPTLAALYTTPVAAYAATNRTISAGVFGATTGMINAVYGNGIWVAPVYNSTTILTSMDGINWVPRYCGFGTATTFSDIAYGNGIFVAISQSANTFTSTDGITWTYRPSVFVSSVAYITFGGGRFVVTPYTTNAAYVSSDGINWQAKTFSASTTWADIAFGNGTFVAVSGTGFCCTSTDYGNTWVARTIPFGLSGITYGGGQFVAVGPQASSTTGAATSPDGITWTTRVLPSAQNWASVAYGNGVYIAISGGQTAASTAAASSTDGITWTARVLTSMYWNNIAFGGPPNNSYFIACPVYTPTFSQVTFTTTIALSVAQTTFSLPVVSAPMINVTPYIKAS